MEEIYAGWCRQKTGIRWIKTFEEIDMIAEPGTPTLDQLKVFLTVIEVGSFAGAARRLNRATSVISYSISNLEAQLGVTLFDRESTRKPQLTEAGRTVLAEARTVTNGIDGLRAKVRGLLQGLEAEVHLAIDVLLPADRLVDALRAFRARGMLLIVISNQSGIPRGLITPAQHAEIDARVKAMLAAEGVPLDGAYYCAHLPEDGCACRKPRPGLLEQAAREHDVELGRSYMVGDKLADVAAGHAVGCTTALLGPGKDVGDAIPHAIPDHRANDWSALLSSMEASWQH